MRTHIRRNFKLEYLKGEAESSLSENCSHLLGTPSESNMYLNRIQLRNQKKNDLF